jgi:hypothetical protein
MAATPFPKKQKTKIRAEAQVSADYIMRKLKRLSLSDHIYYLRDQSCVQHNYV